MKKNKMMRVASALLVAVLMTTSVISGTFAKYVTTDSASDTARVAKWGVVLQVAGNLYGDIYDDIEVADNDDNIAVKTSATGTNVVAPGTKNETGLAYSLNGTPEVAGKITTKIEYENIYLAAGTYGIMVQIPDGVVTNENFTNLGALYTEEDGTYTKASGFTADTTYYTLEDDVTITGNSYYYPVQYSMTGTTTFYTAEGITSDTLKAVVDKMAENLGTAKTGEGIGVSDGKTTSVWEKSFAPNDSLANILKIEGQKITWDWAFEQTDDVTTTDVDEKVLYNGADTILANLQVENNTVVKLADNGSYVAPTAASGTVLNDYNLETSFSIEITVEQVD